MTGKTLSPFALPATQGSMQSVATGLDDDIQQKTLHRLWCSAGHDADRP